jgi:endonuclease/exonuclease/phosphatase family metal-dependent hydrolase
VDALRCPRERPHTLRMDAQVAQPSRLGAWRTTRFHGHFHAKAPWRAVQTYGFLDALGPADSRQTSIRHRHPIDWLFARDIGLTRGRVQRVERVSDHFPLTATLDLSHEER